MKKFDINYLLETVNRLSSIPIWIYKNNKLIRSFTTTKYCVDMTQPYKNEILKIDTSVGYYITPEFLYYGIINYGNNKIVFGPTYQIKPSEKVFKDLAFKFDVSNSDLEKFKENLSSIIPLPLESIIEILCIINYLLNDEKLSIKDVAIFDNIQQLFFKETTNHQQELKEHSEILAPHNTLSIEKTILDIVKNGETEKLLEWSKNAPHVTSGKIASEQIRQCKNTFIVTSTLVSRSAIDGGVDVDDALSLSDNYIQRCELLNNIFEITNLQFNMVLTFTKLVEKIKVGNNSTILTNKIANYISHHLDEKITTTEIAKTLYMSRTYLSKKFKEESGIKLEEFILQQKIKEAQKLLKYTEKTLVQISNYLCFSSQSHFTRVFKQFTGTTPYLFRQEK